MSNVDISNIQYSYASSTDNRRILYYYKSLIDFSFKDFVKEKLNDGSDKLPKNILKCKNICMRVTTDSYKDTINKLIDYITEKVTDIIDGEVDKEKFRSLVYINSDIFIDEYIYDDYVYIEYVNKD